jgi:hypothetical protein
MQVPPRAWPGTVNYPLPAMRRYILQDDFERPGGVCVLFC